MRGLKIRLADIISIISLSQARYLAGALFIDMLMESIQQAQAQPGHNGKRALSRRRTK